MKIKRQVKNWYTKPRKFDGFINWIIFHPKALGITMFMGHITALGIFGTLAVFSWLWWGGLMRFISLVCLALVIRNLYKYVKFQRKTGSIFDTANMYDMLFDKGGKKK